MKKLVVIMVLGMIFASCSDNSVWKKTVISKDAQLQFVDGQYDGPVGNRKIISLPVDTTGDGSADFELKISQFRLLEKICYMKLAYPNSDITIDYVQTKEDGKTTFDVRFANILE